MNILLSAKEVARILDVSVRTLWLWEKRGRLVPIMRRGPHGARVVRWHPEAVLRVKATLNQKKYQGHLRRMKKQSDELITQRRNTNEAVPAPRLP